MDPDALEEIDVGELMRREVQRYEAEAYIKREPWLDETPNSEIQIPSYPGLERRIAFVEAEFAKWAHRDKKFLEYIDQLKLRFERADVSEELAAFNTRRIALMDCVDGVLLRQQSRHHAGRARPPQ